MPGHPKRYLRPAARRLELEAPLGALCLLGWLLHCGCGSPARATPNPEPTSPIAVGATAPDFGLPALDFRRGELGEIVWLSDYVGPTKARPAGQPRLLLLNFFAPWCDPCVKELPLLRKLGQRYEHRDLQILSVNYHRQGESIRSAIAASTAMWTPPPDHPVLFDRYTRRVERLYLGDRVVLPTTLLIAADGTVLGRYQGGAPSESKRMESDVQMHITGNSAESATASK